jgi:hypothetical protein
MFQKVIDKCIGPWASGMEDGWSPKIVRLVMFDVEKLERGDL